MDRLDRPAIRIPLRPRIEGRIRVSRPFVLVVPTYGGSEPSTAGNTNFGAHYCLAGPVTKITFKLVAVVAMLPVTILVIRA